MSKIKFSLIESKDRLEESNLRSSLIFNKTKVGKTRNDLMDKTILSIIMLNNVKCSDITISEIFKNRFDVDLDNRTIQNSISNLKGLGLICENDGNYSAINSSEDVFLMELQSETKWLIDSIIDRVNMMKGVTISNKNLAIENIRKALSVYFHMYGYSFFKCQEEATEEKKKEAISLVTQGLEKRFGQALITAIADTLNKPSDREKDILTIWAKAFISSQIMGLDPTLRNFKATAFRGKTFVLDTDVVLNCITNNAKFSNDYKSMVSKLISAGCKLIIPEEVVNEVENHADAAIKRFRISGNQIKEYTDELLECIGSNVFIEDYVKSLRYDEKKVNMPFNVYIGNIYCKDDRDVLNNKLTEVFTKKYIPNIDVKINPKELDSLTEKVNQKTIETEKGANRTDEDNLLISNTDAYLYLAVKEKSAESINNKILSHDFYLLTRTTRTIKAAKELGLYKEDIVCNPNVLLSVLQETGLIDNDKLNVINLFENPFLAYSSSKTWDDIRPILADKQFVIQHKELQQLRHDFKVDLHKLITAQSTEDKMEAAVEITDNGYMFTSELALAAKKEKELQSELVQERKDKEEAIKRADELEKKLKKVTDRSNTGRAITSKNIILKGNRTKKKSGRKKR